MLATFQMNIQAPFGGKKISGIGREFGEYVSRRYQIYSDKMITKFL